MAARKAPAKRPPARKTAAAKKAPAKKKPAAKKPAPKKNPAKRAAAKKAPGRKPAARDKPGSPSDAADVGRHAKLKTLAVAAERALRAAKPNEVAALSRELRQIYGELDAVPVGEEKGSRIDELANKRASRSAGTAGSASATRRSQQRRGNGGRRTS